MKVEISREWCLQAAEREGDSEAGVGSLENILYWWGYQDGLSGKVRRFVNTEYNEGYWNGFWAGFDERTKDQR